MNKGINKLSVVLSTAILFSCFAGIPVLAEEADSSTPLSTQTMEKVEHTGNVEDTREELTTATNEDVSIYSMDDLVAAFGPDNVSVTSATDIKLLRDIIIPGQALKALRFKSGTYNIDFNNCRYEGVVCFYVSEASLTFYDGSSEKSGGITSLPQEYSDNATVGYPAISQFGGQITVKSGIYKSSFAAICGTRGTVFIEGGEFIGTEAMEYDYSIGAWMCAGMKATITGGLFQGTGNGLWAEATDDYEVLQMQISGGTFEGTNDECEDISGILYTDNQSGQAPDILSLLAPSCILSPATITTRNSMSLTEKSVRVTQVDVEPSEGVKSFVNRLYSLVLGRKADPTGFSEWVKQLANRQISGSTAAFGFFFSTELQNRNLSDQEFVTLLYSVFFDRKPDDGGLKNWLSALENGASRKYVFSGFANSQEWKNLCTSYGIEPGSYTSDEARDQNLKVTAFVQRLYNLCLNRKADAEGLNHWTASLNSKNQDGAQTAHGFFFSKEFKSRNLSNEDFVEVLYKVLLGRSSDAAGKADWVEELTKGTDRLDVFRGFVYSKEFDEICTEYGIRRGTI